MHLDEVRKMPPCARFIYWIKERHAIHVRRRKGKLKPWTDDEILLKYKFCNVRRIHDRVSQWLLDNWYGPFQDHPNMLVACTLARQFNVPETLEAVGFPEKWEPKKIAHILSKRQDRGLVNYSGAYMIAALEKDRPKHEQSIWSVCDPIAKRGKIDSSSMEKTWECLCQFAGLGSFMAGQVVADLRWAVTGDWADARTWAPAGPGSIRGANRLYERPLDKKIRQETFLTEMRRLYDQFREIDGIPPMEMMDFQNCHCEWDKYERALWNEGRPKQLYPGAAEIKTVDGLRKQQIDILQALQGAGVPLSRKQISDISGVDQSKIGDFAGPRPANQSEKTKEKWPFPSLIDFGHVVMDTYDVNGRDLQMYSITKSGKQSITQE